MILAQREQLTLAKSEVTVGRLEIERLKLMLAKARREQFGQSSERGKLLGEQLELAIEDLEVTQAEQEAKAEIAAPSRPREASAKSAAASTSAAGQPAGQRIVELAPCACGKCGSVRLHKLGEVVSKTLECEPRQRCRPASLACRRAGPAPRLSCQPSRRPAALELEGQSKVQGRRCCFSDPQRKIAPTWGAGRVRTFAVNESFQRLVPLVVQDRRERPKLADAAAMHCWCGARRASRQGPKPSDRAGTAAARKSGENLYTRPRNRHPRKLPRVSRRSEFCYQMDAVTYRRPLLSYVPASNSSQHR